jgi:hypothetical protein
LQEAFFRFKERKNAQAALEVNSRRYFSRFATATIIAANFLACSSYQIAPVAAGS